MRLFRRGAPVGHGDGHDADQLAPRRPHCREKEGCFAGGLFSVHVFRPWIHQRCGGNHGLSARHRGVELGRGYVPRPLFCAVRRRRLVSGDPQESISLDLLDEPSSLFHAAARPDSIDTPSLQAAEQ